MREAIPLCLVVLVVILTLALATAAFIYDPPVPSCPKTTETY